VPGVTLTVATAGVFGPTSPPPHDARAIVSRTRTPARRGAGLLRMATRKSFKKRTLPERTMVDERLQDALPAVAVVLHSPCGRQRAPARTEPLEHPSGELASNAERSRRRR